MTQHPRSAPFRGLTSYARVLLPIFLLAGCATGDQKPDAPARKVKRVRANVRTEIAMELQKLGGATSESAARLQPSALTAQVANLQGLAIYAMSEEGLPVSGGEVRAHVQASRPSNASAMPVAAASTKPETRVGAAKATAEKISPAPRIEMKSTGVPAARAASAEAQAPVTHASAPKQAGIPVEPSPRGGLPIEPLRKLSVLDKSSIELSSPTETPLIFDIPVTYNDRVKKWVRFFQTDGRRSFRSYLARSSRYLPLISSELTRAGLPQDLVYVAMIESGFVPSAVSHKHAMGMWQFIAPTGRRYGLDVDWWIDERKDFHKATRAAISYMRDLYKQFGSWYLVAASYNMGEGGVRRLIKRHGTNNFWELADRNALPSETRDYVPKIIAAMLISKAPGLYGFRDIEYQMPLSFETLSVPGGTDLINLASYLGVSEKYLKELNPELVKGFIPRHIVGHQIRVPKGSLTAVSQYVTGRPEEGI